VGALVQIAISTAFMLALGFPRIMIAIFGGLILLAAAFSPNESTHFHSTAKTSFASDSISNP